MRGGQSKAAGYVQHRERFHSDNELSAAITRLRSQRDNSEASGVLVTWHGPWSYTLELCHRIQTRPDGPRPSALPQQARNLNDRPFRWAPGTRSARMMCPQYMSIT